MFYFISPNSNTSNKSLKFSIVATAPCTLTHIYTQTYTLFMVWDDTTHPHGHTASSVSHDYYQMAPFIVANCDLRDSMQHPAGCCGLIITGSSVWFRTQTESWKLGVWVLTKGQLSNTVQYFHYH